MGELAARLGSPNVWDRRGDTLLIEQFEDGLTGWQEYAGASDGSSGLTTELAKSGSISLKVTSATGASELTGRGILIPYNSATRFGVETAFCLAGAFAMPILALTWYDGTHGHQGRVRYNPDSNKLQYWASDGTWKDLAVDILTYEGAPYFSQAKLVVDVATGRYSHFLLDGYGYDMSAYELRELASSLASGIFAAVWLTTVAGVAGTAYFDDVIITQNEP